MDKTTPRLLTHRNLPLLLINADWSTIQAIAEYPTSQNDDGGYEIYTSQVVNVLTTNQITFPDMLLTFGTALDIRATLDTLITNWTVSIISPSNQTLRTYSGITSNGHIDVVWDGNDSNAVHFAGPYVDVIVNDPAKRRPYHEGPTPGLPPRAFVGWTSAKVYGTAGTFNDIHGNFIINFFNDWSNNSKGLQQAITDNLPSGFTAPQVWGATDLRWNQ